MNVHNLHLLLTRFSRAKKNQLKYSIPFLICSLGLPHQLPQLDKDQLKVLTLPHFQYICIHLPLSSHSLQLQLSPLELQLYKEHGLGEVE